MENWVKLLIIFSVVIVFALIIFIILALIFGTRNLKKKNALGKTEKYHSSTNIFKDGIEVFYYNEGEDYHYDNMQVLI